MQKQSNSPTIIKIPPNTKEGKKLISTIVLINKI